MLNGRLFSFSQPELKKKKKKKKIYLTIPLPFVSVDPVTSFTAFFFLTSVGTGLGRGGRGVEASFPE